MAEGKLRKPEPGSVRLLGLACIVLALILMVCAVRQWPGDAPAADDMVCINRRFASVERTGAKSSRYESRLYALDGSSYWMSGILELDLDAFREKVQPGDVLQLYLREGELYAIYKEDGTPVHSIEDSFNAEVRNCYGLAAFGGFWMLLGVAILVNSRRIYRRLLKEYRGDMAKLEKSSKEKKRWIEHLWK